MDLEEIKKKHPEFSGKWTKTTKNLTGQKFNKLTVLYRAENRKSRTCWVCRCDCGNISIVYTYNLSINHTCSCGRCGTQEKQWLNEEIYTRPTYKDLTGKQFGDLKVICKEGNFIADNRVAWKCQCTCGNIVIIDSHTLNQGRKINCGCKIPYSQPVINIALLLKNNGIKFKQEYRFDDCRDINPLPFDFLIEDKYIIEYDGMQHFKEIEFWKGFEERRKHDLLKNHYCFSKNIPLIRIPAEEEYNISDLKLETTRFLLTQDNEEEYYRRYTIE